MVNFATIFGLDADYYKQVQLKCVPKVIEREKMPPAGFQPMTSYMEIRHSTTGTLCVVVECSYKAFSTPWPLM